MKPSVLRRLKWSMMSFGFAMGCIFPVYASFFVDWREGMMPFFVLGALGAGIIVGLVNNFFVRWLLFPHLLKISDLAEALEAGDLTITAGISSSDQLGKIASDVENACLSMSELLQGVRLQSVNLEGVAGQTRLSTDVLAKSTSHMSKLSDKLDETAEHLLSSVELSASSAQKIDQTSSMGMKKTLSVSGSVEKTASSLGTVDFELGEVARSINKITGVFASFATSAEQALASSIEAKQAAGHSIVEVEGLISSLKVIAGLTDQVDGVAGKTRLLALNAAIQSAGAGEAGLGFSVFAREIRDLSDQIFQLTKSIDKQLGCFQELAQEVNEQALRISSSTEKAETQARVISEGLSSYSGEAKTQTERLNLISRGVRHASLVMKDHSKDLNKLTEIMEDLASGASELAQTSSASSADSVLLRASLVEVKQSVGEVCESAHEISQSTVNLHSGSQDLEQLVGRFKC